VRFAKPSRAHLSPSWKFSARAYYTSKNLFVKRKIIFVEHRVQAESYSAEVKARDGGWMTVDRGRGESGSVLLEDLKAHGTSIPDPVFEAARTLDKLYIPTRYPNGFSSGAPGQFYGEKDARGAIQDAGIILGKLFDRPDIEEFHV
jgi:hypothetical protein